MHKDTGPVFPTKPADVAILRRHPPFIAAIGKGLAEERAKKSMARAQLAETLGVTDATLKEIENGQRRTVVSLVRAATAELGINYHDFLVNAFVNMGWNEGESFWKNLQQYKNRASKPRSSEANPGRMKKRITDPGEILSAAKKMADALDSNAARISHTSFVELLSAAITADAVESTIRTILALRRDTPPSPSLTC